ncbi:RNA methyltransferase [Bacteroidetes bacterium SCGC AAA795-G10]|nr:RNA methyltransferase [Bacteroidetes bacterium SCGC AAA795-G10]
MVSKNQLKQILKLKHKKYRTRFGYFVAEGEKIVNDLINSSWHAQSLYSLEDNFHPKAIKIDFSVMKKISHLKTPSPVLGVFKIPNKIKIKPSLLTLAIDKLIDPGNLGSIIRLCDWFGVDELVCSSDTVDCYNSKVIQSSMGSIARVRCNYQPNLEDYLKSLKKPIFGATLDGQSIYKKNLPIEATYVFGNESNGISDPINKILDEKLTIPNQRLIDGANSLNVATSAAIFLSEIFR